MKIKINNFQISCQNLLKFLPQTVWKLTWLFCFCSHCNAWSNTKVFSENTHIFVSAKIFAVFFYYNGMFHGYFFDKRTQDIDPVTWITFTFYDYKCFSAIYSSFRLIFYYNVVYNGYLIFGVLNPLSLEIHF